MIIRRFQRLPDATFHVSRGAARKTRRWSFRVALLCLLTEAAEADFGRRNTRTGINLTRFFHGNIALHPFGQRIRLTSSFPWLIVLQLYLPYSSQRLRVSADGRRVILLRHAKMVIGENSILKLSVASFLLLPRSGYKSS